MLLYVSPRIVLTEVRVLDIITYHPYPLQILGTHSTGEKLLRNSSVARNLTLVLRLLGKSVYRGHCWPPGRVALLSDYE
jgi:hypothetical protein